MQLTEKEKERYNRQIQLDEIGEKGQTLLRQAKILIVGVGGLGSPIAIYLCGAGVGTIGLVDDDKVSETNLQRQILYNETEIGKPKALCAKERLQKLNSNICIEVYPTRLTKENAQEIISRYDIVVDGCDNFQTRYLINDTCLLLNKVYVYGAIRAFDGQVSVFNYQGRKKLPRPLPRRGRNAVHACSSQRGIRSYSRLSRLHTSQRGFKDNFRIWRSFK